MTRRPGKAPAQPSNPRIHLEHHLHLTNNIHVKNHVHMPKDHNQMLDPRRTPQLPLRRELTAVKKVKSLQDPSTSSNSFSPMSASSSVARHECRGRTVSDRDHLDDLLLSQTRVRRPPTRSKNREGTEEFVDRSRGSSNGISRGESLRKSQVWDGSRGRRRDEYRDAAAPSHWSAAGYRVEERWHGDAEEIARRLIAEQKGSISSPAHSYMASLARAHGLSLLGFRDDITTSEAEGSFLESEDGDAGLIASEYLSNSAGSPLIVRGHRNRRRGKDGYGYGNGNSSLRVGLHSRERKAVHSYKEAPVVPTMTDELDVSDIPQNGCGMPWYKTSGAAKFKSKSLLDYACAIPEAVSKKKAGDSKQVSRNSSRHGSKRDHKVPDDCSAVPLLNSAENEIEETPAREARGPSVPPSREKSPSGEEAVSNTQRSSMISHKHRPRSFKDMVGQALVVKSLTTAITKGKVAPVYVFAGPHGTGKSSCARVFAAALVCLNTEPHRRPCGLCRECATVTLNRNRDVKEIDVSSCSDLDHIKSLLTLSSSMGHQRVFIIEGCDFLSIELWTLFLKFIDSLPRNVVSVLIVTDLERLPTSATSRCQKYHFLKLKESEIVNKLQTIAEKERLDVDEAALLLIASRADGSLRDAEAMLDQFSLLDQAITLSMVQELSGLISDEKLVNLLDMALAADTVHTVQGMRELLDAGIDALSLVAQLASLITNILAGTFELRRATRKKGFFQRNMPRREEQQRLRQALKVLAECEKQLRASNDRPTWLTAALLQFAPDRSYLPSSVDTSMAPSPIAFDTLDRVPPGDSFTPRLPSPQAAAGQKKHSQKSSTDIASRLQGQKDKDKAPVSVHSLLEQKDASTANQHQSKMHPSATEVVIDRGLRAPSSLALFDASRIGNRDFRELPRRDMEHIWGKVLDGCRSNVLRQLLSSHGTLMAISVARDETFAVAHVEFGSSEHKARAERLRSSTCHAFQMALGCPVELKLSLECPPSVVLEEIKASHATHPESSSSEVRTQSSTALENALSEIQLHQRRNKPASRQEMLSGLAARSRRLSNAQSGPRLDSQASTSDYKYCFPVSGSSRRHRSGRRPSLSRVPSLDAPGVKVRWKHPKFKGIAKMERKNRKVERVRRRTHVALCWKPSPLSEVEQQPQEQTERCRKRGFFLRLVPCGRSIQTHGSPIRP